MSMHDVKGINESELTKLSLEIIEYAEKLNEQFNKADELIQSTTTFYTGDVGDEFRIKFDHFKENFKVMSDNIMKYSEDLARVKNSMDEFDTETSVVIKKVSNDVSSQNYVKAEVK